MASAVVKSAFTPTRLFFRVNEAVPSITHARAIFKTLKQYGDLVDYKFMRCPETQKYLPHGLVVYKHAESAEAAMSQNVIKAPADLFSEACQITLDKSSKPLRP